MEKRWHLHRGGLLNFWYYDDQEFHFSNGRLLLRGDNGAGKSVTMQSFIPILLDGKKSPDRLDPFGSRARKIEDYLLGEKSLNMPDERTGYVYLEFKMADLDRYKTIGIGLKGKRGTTPKFWGFYIDDNRRIGHDFFLYKESLNDERIPLSKRELENRLEPGGRLVDSQGDYMRMVNQMIFGFENLESYEELIKLLIQLRTPKLSKDFKPTVIYEILTDSLPALSDEDLRPLSETIENMDTIKEQLDALEKQLEAASQLEKAYDEYNQFTLYEKTHELLKVSKRSKEQQKEIEQLQKTIGEQKEELNKKLGQQESRQSELENAKKLEENLREGDSFKALRERNSLIDANKLNQENLRERDQRLQKKETDERKIRQEIQELDDEINQIRKDIQDGLLELEELAHEVFFELQHSMAQEELTSNLEKYLHFTNWHQDINQYLEKVKMILGKVQAVQHADERQQERKKDLGQVQARLDQVASVLKRSEQLLLEEKENFIQSIFEWQQENVLLTDLSESIQQTASLIENYPEISYAQLKEPIRQVYEDLRDDYKDQRLSLRNQAKAKAEEHAERYAEWEKWKNKADPEPERHPDKEKARERLGKLEVPHLPFFAAVEFREGVSEDEKAQLESALQEMGYLDTLILPSEYEQGDLLKKEGLKDSYFQRNPQLLRPTLLDYLKPAVTNESDISPADVDDILRSILIFDEGTQENFVNLDGTYALGIRRGVAPQQEKSIFIGLESRKRFRQEMLQKLKDELDQLKEEIQELNMQIAKCDENLELLDRELQQFPAEADLATAYKMFDESKRHYQSLEKDVVEKNELWKEALNHYQELNKELQRLLTGEKLPAKERELKDIIQAIEEYRYGLVEVEKSHNNLLTQIKMIQVQRERLEELEVDIDDIRVDLRDIRREIKNNQERIEQLSELLEQEGFAEIKKQLEECVQKIRKLPGEINSLTKDIATLETNIERDKVEAEKMQNVLDTYLNLQQICTDIWLEEVQLGYYRREGVTDTLTGLDLAKAIQKELQEWVKKHQLDRSKVETKLIQVFHQQQNALLDYHIAMIEIFQDWDTLLRQNPEGEYLTGLAKRQQIVVELEGKRVSPYQLCKQLQDSIITNETLLSETDRQLYEEILMQNVGQRIRSRIFRAQNWVKEMNVLMAERDTSSGLIFSLKWHPEAAETENELDVRELVELMKRDSVLLQEEDFRKVTEHFRSRINRARSFLEEKGYGESLHQAIKEVLDYRKWFQFSLYYQKSGERKRELTNHVFNTFSGGEKAMAMYIPLFSAVYSHYQQAHKTAPWIITLDEAFAGVDENNIRDMFALVEQLGFDFIMNSQALWGDYDTVSHLSIAELIRPKNANYVSVMHYQWDGEVRSLVTAVEEEIHV